MSATPISVPVSVIWTVRSTGQSAEATPATPLQVSVAQVHLGLRGIQGVQGVQGLQGGRGEKGDIGDAGPAGPQGVAGPAGAPGADGAQGPAGPQGVAGPAGAPGADGAQGPAGPQGVAGPAGADGADFTPPPLLPFDAWVEAHFSSISNPIDPFAVVSISAATFHEQTLVANADGFWQNGFPIRSSVTANSGYRFQRYVPHTVFGSRSHKHLAAWRPVTLENTLVRAGFHDTTTSSSPVDGAWIEVVGGVASGKTKSNGVESTTVSSLALTAGSVYLLDVDVNATATLVTYKIFDGISGAVLWEDSLTTTIPSGAAMATNTGLVATSSGTTAISIGVLYMMGFGTPAGYARARG